MFGVISLVAVVLVFVLFYTIVVQKTKDIGVLKAVGGSNGNQPYFDISRHRPPPRRFRFPRYGHLPAGYLLIRRFVDSVSSRPRRAASTDACQEHPRVVST